MKNGFSFLELIVVLVIAVVVTTLAMPSYARYTEKSRGRNAEANLKIIYEMEKRFRLENGDGKYWVCDGACPGNLLFVCSLSSPCTTKLINDNAGTFIRDQFFNYSIIKNAALSTYTARATRIGTGLCGGRIMWINKYSSDVNKTGCNVW